MTAPIDSNATTAARVSHAAAALGISAAAQWVSCPSSRAAERPCWPLVAISVRWARNASAEPTVAQANNGRPGVTARRCADPTSIHIDAHTTRATTAITSLPQTKGNAGVQGAVRTGRAKASPPNAATAEAIPRTAGRASNGSAGTDQPTAGRTPYQHRDAWISSGGGQVGDV